MFENEDRHWWFQGTRSVILDVARNVLAPKEDATLRILDVGCGTGATLRVLSAFGEAHGLEPDGQAVAHCHKRGLESVVQGRAEDLPYEDDFFDVLVALDVLEHLEDDRAALKEMKRVVRPGGHRFNGARLPVPLECARCCTAPPASIPKKRNTRIDGGYRLRVEKASYYNAFCFRWSQRSVLLSDWGSRILLFKAM